MENEKLICYYKADGSCISQEPLGAETLGNINGMMVRCYMADGSEQEGFADPYRVHNKSEYDGKVGEIICLWTWDNLDETTHQLVGEGMEKYDQTYVPVKIENIMRIDAILYSNPRWGARLTNRFGFFGGRGA